jgi:hypothetical protein
VEDLKCEIQQLKEKIAALEEENRALTNQVSPSFSYLKLIFSPLFFSLYTLRRYVS